MVAGPGLPWKKRRELGFVEILFRRLGLMATTITATEDGADAVITLSDGVEVSVQVTDFYLTDDGQSPQARAGRWRALWRRLRDAIDPGAMPGLLSIEFVMDGGRPAMPPSRDFPGFVEEVAASFRDWNRQSIAVASPVAGSVLAQSVAFLHFEPDAMSDISSNHQASFIPPVEEDALAKAIKRKVQGPRRPGTNWLLVVTGTDLHQPIGDPGEFADDPDPDRAYERVFLYDGLHQAIREKTGTCWSHLNGDSSEVQ